MSWLPSLTPQLNSHLNEYSSNHLVLNLSNAAFIDSSIIRLFLNIQKRLHESSKELYLLCPSKNVREILDTTNLSQSMRIIDDLSELETECKSKKYLPYSYDENGMARLQCSCAVCGSQKVIGYFLDCSSFFWSWGDDDIFPLSVDKENQNFDFFSALPVICTECYMCSIDLTQFNILNKNSDIAFRSTMDLNIKQLLSKTIPKRKKMVESSIEKLSFLYPRTDISSYNAYLLAEDCLRTASIIKTGFNPFMIGFMKFLSIKYSSMEKRKKLLCECHSWFSLAFQYKICSDLLQLSKLFYMDILSLLSSDKKKQAIELFSEFSDLIKLNDTGESTSILESPHFWFQKTKMILEKETENDADILINRSFAQS